VRPAALGLVSRSTLTLASSKIIPFLLSSEFIDVVHCFSQWMLL
jgi:hypothetical protein